MATVDSDDESTHVTERIYLSTRHALLLVLIGAMKGGHLSKSAHPVLL